MAKKATLQYKLFDAELLANMVDSLRENRAVYFTDDDLSDWSPKDGDQNCLYSIYKGEIYDEDYGVLIMGSVKGGMTVAKDMVLVSDGEPYDREKRIEGMARFIEQWFNEMLDVDKVYVEIKI